MTTLLTSLRRERRVLETREERIARIAMMMDTVGLATSFYRDHAGQDDETAGSDRER